MTIIEAAWQKDTYRSPFVIMAEACPSDHGYKNMRGCHFHSKGEMPDNMVCLKCWTRKYKEKADE